jgi:hypothetical protein
MIPRIMLALSVAIALSGCRGGHDAGAATPPPAHSGVVWETDDAANRKTAAATMLAYANGLHVIVLDGDDVFAGMTRLASTARPGGGRSIQLANGLTAELVPVSDAMELRFSSGETVRMRQREAGR